MKETPDVRAERSRLASIARFVQADEAFIFRGQKRWFSRFGHAVLHICSAHADLKHSRPRSRSGKP